MKDTTAILVHYDDKAMLYKALNSLRKIDSRLKSIIVLHEWKMIPYVESGMIEFVRVDSNEHGQLLNDIICKLSTSYVLFLRDMDYLSPTTSPDTLKLPDTKAVLGTFYYNQNLVIHNPVFVRTSLLKKVKFPLQVYLPFKEALFPAWLANVEIQQQRMKEDLVRKAGRNRFANTIQKEKIIQKYQLEKNNMKHPTVSVVIATYNMEKYVETAVSSCLLQNGTFDQVLIMDDGSVDNSYKWLQRWNGEKQIKIFRKKNEGKAKALNELLPHVTSDFILELDADDWLDPDACSIIKKHLCDLSENTSVLYGNLKKWKQLAGDILFKEVAKGVSVRGKAELLSYRFPLGPRIYRTSILKEEGGFPVIAFEDGRLYEDVSVLNRLLKKYPFRYKDFTVYNVREHHESITKKNDSKWRGFLKSLHTD